MRQFYRRNGETRAHHERARFRRMETGQWRFAEGASGVPKHRADRIGRSDPCPCGSGKKLKKCCGAAGGAIGGV